LLINPFRNGILLATIINKFENIDIGYIKAPKSINDIKFNFNI